MRTGEGAADVAIRWHEELTAIRDLRLQRAAQQPQGRQPKPQPKEWVKRLDQCYDILTALNELPELASEFAESVRDKVQGMAVWIDSKEAVTQKMCDSLDNIQQGVERWQR